MLVLPIYAFDLFKLKPRKQTPRIMNIENKNINLQFNVNLKILVYQIFHKLK